MNARAVLSSAIRVTWLSALGLVQLMLVMFGCVYVAGEFAAAVPAARLFGIAAPFIGFFSLLYPVFVSQTFRTARPESA